jgi:hypothetical protein
MRPKSEPKSRLVALKEVRTNPALKADAFARRAVTIDGDLQKVLNDLRTDSSPSHLHCGRSR